SRPPKSGGLVAVFLLEPARRPVVVGRVAATRTVERGDVLERNEDVSVQLNVGDVLHVAVGGQDTFLVFAAEECDLDLLALVFVGVVLDAPEPSENPLSYVVVLAVQAAKCAALAANHSRGG